MAAQFITHDEFEAGQDHLFMRLTAFMASQLDLIRTQMREDKRETIERSQADKTEVLVEIKSLHQRMGDLEAAQTTLKGTTEGYGKDTSRQIADGIAAINESLNEMSQRLSKLEEK